MIDVYSDAFQKILAGMESIAAGLKANRTIEDAKTSIQETLAERLQLADQRAEDDAKNYKEHHPGATGTEVEQLREELRVKYHREAQRKRDGEIDRLSRSYPAEFAILKAIDQMQKDWYISPASMEYFGEAVEAIAYQSDKSPNNFSYEIRDAIRRGSTARDADSANVAIEAAKRARKSEEKQRQLQLAKENAARLRAEQEELERHIQEQEAPKKRLAEIKKQLAEATK